MPITIPTGLIEKQWTTQVISGAVTVQNKVEYINNGFNDIVLTSFNLNIGDSFAVTNAGVDNTLHIPIVNVSFIDRTSTTKPVGVSPLIDGIAVKDNDTVIFTALTGAEVSDNNKVFNISNTSTSATYTLIVSPVLNNVTTVRKGLKGLNKTYIYNGTTWNELLYGTVVLQLTVLTQGQLLGSYKLSKPGVRTEFIKTSSFEFTLVNSSGIIEFKPYGYIRGYSVGPSQTNYEHFSFKTDALAVIGGLDLTPTRNEQATCSSNDYGYLAGGEDNTNNTLHYNNIYKFNYNFNSNQITVGVLSVARRSAYGHSSADYGYVSGGYTGAVQSTVISRMSFTTDGNSTNTSVGLTTGVSDGAAASSSAYAYLLGDSGGVPINKHPFSTDIKMISVGNLTVTGSACMGCNSDDNAYVGGYWSNISIKTIDKVSFSVDANAASIGDMSSYRTNPASHSSEDNGYFSGGVTPAAISNIDRFSFTTELGTVTVSSLLLLSGSCVGLSY